VEWGSWISDQHPLSYRWSVGSLSAAYRLRSKGRSDLRNSLICCLCSIENALWFLQAGMEPRPSSLCLAPSGTKPSDGRSRWGWRVPDIHIHSLNQQFEGRLCDEAHTFREHHSSGPLSLWGPASQVTYRADWSALLETPLPHESTRIYFRVRWLLRSVSLTHMQSRTHGETG